MESLGFSFVGAAFLLALVIPNLIWWRWGRPAGYDPSGEGRVLGAVERVGQVLVTVAALVFADTNLRPWTAWSWWLAGAIAAMVAYEGAWVRYFRSARTLDDFTRPMWGIPVPLALLPCVAFVLLGIYGTAWPLVAAALVFAAGHVGIHARRARLVHAASEGAVVR